MESIEFDDIEIIERKAGGIGHDNGFGMMGDFYYTLRRFIFFLQEQGIKGPYIIQSNKNVKLRAGSGAHFGMIAVCYGEKRDKFSWYLRDNLVVNDFVVCEIDYILSLKYVKAWIIQEEQEDYFMVFNERDKKGICTDGLLNLEW